ncbi:hypothetical protein MNEG_6694 [Monoraphidium neglectum]|uniref:Uncharacterized protein n=1 Tax=Monoraphidium neglectum TaxID=145388 RepID=A0A0D2JQB9_9CHLO|nr:hypothetical protein MNEG_6694 [Monoraphidium neglectum]KIZ01268.1 hypothetical protein MNEG_6694 [Monoraphidium neglectum]|eukprot:XP_013900287.1 hypothetical protein MNEG_6694 [Monoraphidium neglectum]
MASSFGWALRGGALRDADCGHDPLLCNCSAASTATQTLDELEFARSACQAAAAGRADKLAGILQRAPDAVHSDGGKGTSGYTPLHYAARAGHLECAALLLRAGACVDARTVQGRATPLHRAAHVGSLDVVKLLVAAGADGLTQDADGETALHKAAAEGHAAVAAFLIAAFTGACGLRDRRGRVPRDRAAGAAAALEWPEQEGGAGGGG